MNHRTSTFSNDLRASTRCGLTRGVALLEWPQSAAQAEMNYRSHRLLAEAQNERLRRSLRGRGKRSRTGRTLLSGWTAWLPSVPTHRSSAVPRNSSACGN